MPLDPSRTVAELRELQELTGDADGAQRVAWTDTWVRAKDWLDEKVPLEADVDEAGNQWWTLPGRSERAVLIGGHIDSVPNGGWLDGALNVVAGVEVMRRLAEEGEPAATVRLVNWADEEGARFGRSLFGSSAAAGSMADQDELRTAGRRRERAARSARRPRGGPRARRPTRASETPPPTSSSTSSKARCSSRSTCRSASSSARSASSATRSHSAARLPTPARRRWTSAATRSPAPRSSSSRSVRSPSGPAAGPSAHGRRRHEAGHRHVGRRDRREPARSAPSRRGDARRDARRGESRLGAVRAGGASRSNGSGSGRSSRSSSTTTLIELADEAVREVAGTLAPPPERAAARRGRGLPRGCADGDALRPEPARPLAHEARGHEGGAPRARRAGARPARDRTIAWVASRS